MISFHGPYRHRKRWRIAFRVRGNGRLHYRSYETESEATAAMNQDIAEMDDAALAALPPPVVLPEDPCWVYMLLCGNGSVVYVGATRRLDRRCYAHRENGVEFDRMVFYPEPFDRPQALAVEAALIRKHKPALNLAGTVERETGWENNRLVPRVWKRQVPKT